MELLYIKANGEQYSPCKPNTQIYGHHKGSYHPVCRIKRLMFGRWQIDYYDEYCYDDIDGYTEYRNQAPNARLILYPSGIQEIKYRKQLEL